MGSKRGLGVRFLYGRTGLPVLAEIGAGGVRGAGVRRSGGAASMAGGVGVGVSAGSVAGGAASR